MRKEFEAVIGLEIHVHLKTKTKIFCSCRNSFEEEPNKNICPVCLGLPGVLPVFNKKALQLALRAALALGCRINSLMRFDRKNYFYPDLPKNYQISQYKFPLAERGNFRILTSGKEKEVLIKRVHLEEDAGKLIHSDDASFVDYNRAGCPLVEIVTEPVLFSPQEAYDFLQQLKMLLQYLEVSDCDMEKGLLRCDANISVRPIDTEKLGIKTELKNMNSFRAVKLALEYEINRQINSLLDGEEVVQETRLWDEKLLKTKTMRLKEEVHDYRYFPEPDLPPFTIGTDWINEVKSELPQFPLQRYKKLRKKEILNEDEIFFLIQEKSIIDFFEKCLQIYNNPRSIYNWLKGTVAEYMNEYNITAFSMLDMDAVSFVKIVKSMDKGLVNNQQAKKLFLKYMDTRRDPEEIIEEEGFKQISDTAMLEEIVDKVIEENLKAVEDYKAGKEKSLMFLVGQVMRHTRGRANPSIVREILLGRLR